MKKLWILLLILIALVLTGCGGGARLTPAEPHAPPVEEPALPPTDSPNPHQPVEVSPLPTPSPDPSLQGDSTLMPDPSNPALQKLIEAASQDLTQRFSIPLEQIQFKEAFAVTWNDSSLGCPRPDAMYLQVLTPGYLIRLQATERIFEYHTDTRGTVVYCENPSALPLEALPKE
jgi:hypothetical protein